MLRPPVNIPLSLFLFLFSYQFAPAQEFNLVQNPGFESYHDCPEFLGSVRSYNVNVSQGVLENWMANPPDCTPDYFHPCGKKKFRVPTNICGKTEAWEGEAYVGLIMRIGAVEYGVLSDLLYREHITSKLIHPLKEDFLYRVSFYVYRTDYANYAIGNIGAFFSEEPVLIKEDQQYEAQILSPKNKLYSKNKWVKIEDTLKAKGKEAYITLGNFDQYRNKFIRRLHRDRIHQKKFNFNRAYYYLDQVSVVELGPAPPDSIPPSPAPEELLRLEGGTEIILGEPLILDSVFFDFDKAILLPNSFPQLNEIVKLLIQYPDYQIEIIGHTDSIGTIQKNQGLSLRRAQAVADYLLANQIEKKRLFAQGYGENQPIASNADAEGRRRNRRVEMIIRKKE